MDQQYRLNVTQLAEAFNLHRDTIRKKLKAAKVKAAEVRGNAAYYEIAAASKAIIGNATTAESDSVNPDELDPLQRKAWFDSENARLKFETECGNLIPAHEVARAFAEFAKSISNPLDGLPDLLERKCALKPEQAELVQKQVDSIRENMFLAVINNGGDLED